MRVHTVRSGISLSVRFRSDKPRDHCPRPPPNAFLMYRTSGGPAVTLHTLNAPGEDGRDSVTANISDRFSLQVARRHGSLIIVPGRTDDNRTVRSNGTTVANTVFPYFVFRAPGGRLGNSPPPRARSGIIFRFVPKRVGPINPKTVYSERAPGAGPETTTKCCPPRTRTDKRRNGRSRARRTFLPENVCFTVPSGRTTYDDYKRPTRRSLYLTAVTNERSPLLYRESTVSLSLSRCGPREETASPTG